MVKSFPNQKQYLKKYLSGNKQKNKIKKGTTKIKGVKLIDDDEAVKVDNDDQEELILEGEDAPQIILGEGVEKSVLQSSLKRFRTVTRVEPEAEKTKFVKNFSAVITPHSSTVKTEGNSNKELSRDSNVLPSISHHDSYNIKSKEMEEPRRSCSSDLSPVRRKRNNRSRKENRHSKNSENRSTTNRRYSSDISPPRKTDNKSKIKEENSPKQKHHSDYFLSKNSHAEPKSARRSNSSDLSPPRKMNSKKDANNSIRSKNEEYYRYSESNRRKNRRSTSSENSLPKSKKESKTVGNERTNKMADGKSAGLSSAKQLKEELQEIKKKELLMYGTSTSSEHIEPVVRSGARGKIETQEQISQNKRKEEHNERKREIYTRWGKGLKQIEDHRTKLDEEDYESNKPLARYADDKDLDNMLKKVEREGDPMLQYLRSKTEKERANKKLAEMPIYKGDYLENRFGIRPGYRWDGVDRSNGYEKKYFEKQSAKRALQEEAYRYSTEDM